MFLQLDISKNLEENFISKDEIIGKFDARCDEGIFLGYSTKRKAYRCYNKRMRKIVEIENVKVNEYLGNQIRACTYESDDQDVISKPVQTEILNQNDPVEIVN